MPIPKKIFTIWFNEKEEIPDLQKKCTESQKIEGYEHHLITLDNWQNYVSIHYREYIKECLSRNDVIGYVKASDYIRVYLIYKYGGIYMDCDMEVIEGNNFDDIINECDQQGYSMFISKDPCALWANSIIGSEACNQVLKEYIDRVDNNFKGTGDLVYEVGMGAFIDTIWKNNTGIKVYETDYFQPYNHSTGSTNITNNTIVYHHFSKTWIKK